MSIDGRLKYIFIWLIGYEIYPILNLYLFEMTDCNETVSVKDQTDESLMKQSKH